MAASGLLPFPSLRSSKSSAAAPRANPGPESVAAETRGRRLDSWSAPCVAVVSAMAVGIVLDRYLEPWGTPEVGRRDAWSLAAIAVFSGPQAP